MAEADPALPRAGLSGRCVHRVNDAPDDTIARPRALLTSRAAWWALGQMRRENASVAGLARQLGTTWRTLWRAVKPLLVAMAADPACFDGVTAINRTGRAW